MLDLGENDALITVATDGGALYPSERAKTLATRFGGELSEADAAVIYGEHLANVSTEHMIEMTEADRRRVFNLGYYTWVEQQGTPFELFEERRHQSFWQSLRRYVGVWDSMISEFNERRICLIGIMVVVFDAVCGEEIEIHAQCRDMSSAAEAIRFMLEFVDDGEPPTIEVDRESNCSFAIASEWGGGIRPANGMSDDETAGLARSVAGQFSVTLFNRTMG